LSPHTRISDRTRKRLWTHAGDRCAFPGCDQPLLRSTPDGEAETIVGIECHIVAQRDHPSVARAPCLLTEQEREEFAYLIEDCHGFNNIVIMCGVHSTVIDDPQQGYSVADVAAMKAGHEGKVIRERRAARAERAVASSLDETASAQAPLIVADLPLWAGKTIAKLADSEPDTWAWLKAEIGDPPEPSRSVALIEEWPVRLAHGSPDLHFALARIVEGAGHWKAAADVWEHIADLAEGTDRADHLVRAAIDANVSGDVRRRDQLLDEASRLDPECPRLLVERMEDLDLPPAQQLEYLADIATDDPALGALIEAHRARAAMLLPDLDLAQRHLDAAELLAPDALNVKSMSVNLRVQRARTALVNDEPSSLAEATAASVDALELRETLLGMRRFDESVRLLMLAADVPAVLKDGEAAGKLIAKATPEEIGSLDGVAVLGDAALRAGDPELARRFAQAARADDDAAKRIDATARVDLNLNRTHALNELRKLALGSGPEALHAAFARLGACLPPAGAPWDEDIAQVLDVDHPANMRRMMRGLRVMSLARADDLDGAEAQLDLLPDEPWAAELALRVAAIRGDPAALVRAAERFIQFGPDASGQLLVARGFAKAGEYPRAAQTLAVVTNDPNAPPRVRADAFATFMRVLADSGEWQRAGRVWESWRRFTETRGVVDDELSAWQVRVAHHRRRLAEAS
jgi:tetratricopeptide (TPR) repeat protein